jgi:hypothetical protein
MNPMKNTLLFLIFIAGLSFSSCNRDPYLLNLDRFDVRWFDDDLSGTQTPGDFLQFSILINTTASDPDLQFITDWEFAYTVNGTFGGILEGDSGIRSNSVSLDAGVTIKNLPLPSPAPLKPGDVIAFQLWAKDNQGEQVEQTYRYILEP